MALTKGDRAPAFEALDQAGKIHTLQEYRGQWLLLYFYPKDDTPGCTAEACGLRDRFGDLQKLAAIIGVSADDIESHSKFVQKYSLPFTLLADPEKRILGAYGVGSDFKKRVSFLIDPAGVIRQIYEKVDPEKHVAEVVQNLRDLTMGMA
ncbi:peroxiredoxin [Candidatus Peregrinibacteria bacterium]|nr:peroxiredoxin [Candidatus Peregrinibacteria bacterium]